MTLNTTPPPLHSNQNFLYCFFGYWLSCWNRRIVHLWPQILLMLFPLLFLCQRNEWTIWMLETHHHHSLSVGRFICFIPRFFSPFFYNLLPLVSLFFVLLFSWMCWVCCFLIISSTGWQCGVHNRTHSQKVHKCPKRKRPTASSAAVVIVVVVLVPIASSIKSR